MEKNKKKTERRNKIRRRIRSTIRGTSKRPRLSIYKSNKHVYAQLIDDRDSHTLATASTQTDAIESELKDKTKSEGAKVVGAHLAKLAQEKGINKVVFDRSGYKYHGVIKSLAEGAREAGLDF
ncbi:50S ribosomal protein L18 [Aliifodinibius sp. S!AR15-10]|uniref:50S ribosomal protein L18 n=1 Tax=Aliifodinibius sp. S!AR15-10 TaxID=2950437 RepID=UPI00285DE85A|nr:50S ribosomal protein L18 [Aliifodinibius sp. S!AR15-10]MDR8394514.1 50S ribosomal protein L18 [Aliifodinibius sp. S!AR15-10]